MNSALKPVLPQPGVPQPGGQSSPAKGNVASANHAVGLPQGAQNSLHHGNNSASLIGQNLTHHVNAPQPPPHAVPSMAPVTANMAQMAQNMSHHGNLSHVTQNSIPPPSPSKSATTGAPLSLVQEKANTSQPLALTRTPEKKEPDSSSHANGTIESTKSGSNAPTPLKPQNPECNKDKQDIAKTSPSTPKPPEKSIEKPANAQCTSQKSDAPNQVNQTDGPAQPKVATANEPPEKSPSKPADLKPAPPADVAPVQSDNKPTPEAANDSQDKVCTAPVKEESESPQTDSPTKTEEKTLEPSEKPPQVEEKKEEVKEDIEMPKQEEETEKMQKQEEKVEEKKPEVKTPAKPEAKPAPKSTMKLATVTPPMRKRRQLSPTKSNDGVTPAKKSLDADAMADTRIKRNRTKVQLYQSPTPEIAMATKLSASAGRSTPTKPNDDKLIVFYKNEYLAVRNAEGGFYVCQAVQNVYRTTRKIKIRWLSQDKSDPSGETYIPDFYDVTDMECVLTTLSLSRAPGGGGAQMMSSRPIPATAADLQEISQLRGIYYSAQALAQTQLLKAAEEARAKSILERALKAEQSGDANNLELTEEHPDGLDLSLYTDESQLEKKARKRSGSKSSPRLKADDGADSTEEETPIKKARTTPKRSPKSSRKSKSKQNNNKRKSAGSSPVVAATSKTATAVSDKAKAKVTPAKRTQAKPSKADTPLSTPTRKGRRTAKDNKGSPMTPTPSTSTGKATRTPRKPPAKK